MTSDTTQNTSKTFEFTKRKRWGDLLVSELPDAVNIVLSDTCTILYCAPAILEITGLKDADLLDHDFSEFIATSMAEDQSVFRASFDESIQEGTDLHSFLRIRCSEDSAAYSSGSKDVLFEIQGHPHTVEPEGTFLFATAKPYPSRNTEMLNTFLELKIENDRLQYRHSELSKQLPPRDGATPLTLQQLIQVSRFPVSSSSLLNNDVIGFDIALEPSIDDGAYEANYPLTQVPTSQEDDHEDGSKKKKPKKAQTIEQYVCVTCGRTDSPEWRKGPLGPKTLCNACGLRWAKQTRTEKVEEDVPVC